MDFADRAAVLALLTVRYATGQRAEDWKRHGQPLGASAEGGIVGEGLAAR